MGANSAYKCLLYSIILIGAFFYFTPYAEATFDLSIEEQNRQFETLGFDDDTFGFGDDTFGFGDDTFGFGYNEYGFPEVTYGFDVSAVAIKTPKLPYEVSPPILSRADKVTSIKEVKIPGLQLIVINENERFLKYKQDQAKMSEQKRDEILDRMITNLPNPYQTEIIEQELNQEVISNSDSPKNLKRIHDVFQSNIDEQNVLAQEKLKRVLGEKEIHNVLENIQDKIKSNSNTQDVSLDRTGELFKKYKQIQINIAEQKRDEILDSKVTNLPNPYKIISIEFELNQEVISDPDKNEGLEQGLNGVIPDYVEYVITNRNDDIFQDLIIEQNTIAELKVREILRDEEIHNVLEDTKVEILNFEIPKNLERHHDVFQSLIDEQIILAQNKLAIMMQQTGTDLYQIKPLLEETNMLVVFKTPYNGDKIKAFKDIQEDLANIILKEILGGKDYHNKNY